MKTVIMAGGKGSRLAKIAKDIPKPLIKVGDMPILEHTINHLKAYGLVDIIITVGYMADKIINYFGDGARLGVKITYYREEKPLGNAGALFEIKDILDGDFLLLNADIMFDMDLERLIEYHSKHKSLATIVTHPNSHPYDSGIVICDNDNIVQKWLNKEDDRPRWYKNQVNAGIHIISPKLINSVEKKETIDLDRDILKPLAGTGGLLCYYSPEYIKDLGTPDRYNMVCEDFSTGKIIMRSLRRKQKAVFLDRDGTINRHIGFLDNIDDFELLPGVEDAIKSINSSGYLAIVVTNQPVIARGALTIEGLTEIHYKMETLLGVAGAYLDDIFFCPHHPDAGFVGEIKSLKINCNCRKPEIGLLVKAAEKYNIDLRASWMIGDSESDMMAGNRAGCNTIKIDDNCSLLTAVRKIIESDTV